MDIVAFAKDSKVAQCFFVATAALLVYDYLVTLPLEIAHVWSSKWSYAKGLFIIARYLVFVDMPLAMYFEFGPISGTTVCRRLFVFVSWLYFGASTVSDAILIMRTWAVMGGTKKWVWILCGTYGPLWMAMFIIVIVESVSLTATIVPLVGYPSCLVAPSLNVFVYEFGLFALYHLAILLVTIFKVIMIERPAFILAGPLYRDALIFSTALFALSLINVVLLLSVPELSLPMMVLQRGLQAILPCRVLLHIREAHSTSVATAYSSVEELELSPASPLNHGR